MRCRIEALIGLPETMSAKVSVPCRHAHCNSATPILSIHLLEAITVLRLSPMKLVQKVGVFVFYHIIRVDGRCHENRDFSVEAIILRQCW